MVSPPILGHCKGLGNKTIIIFRTHTFTPKLFQKGELHRAFIIFRVNDAEASSFEAHFFRRSGLPPGVALGNMLRGFGGPFLCFFAGWPWQGLGEQIV